MLDLSAPRVMGILNATPDSFSDGGRFVSVERAVEHALRMEREGAAIIDVGGESTRPGSGEVGAQEEIDRVVPIVESLARALRVPISVDTTKPEVMRAAAQAGAGLINDILALRAPGAPETVAALGLPVCLMHMQGVPRTMQQDPHYDDVVGEVREFLAARVKACEAAGIAPSRLLLDPGFGFGKTLAHNCALLKRLPEAAPAGYPLLVGVSRKSMIGQILERPVGERLHGSVAAAVIAVWQGAAIVRAHDVRATVEAIALAQAVRTAS